MGRHLSAFLVFGQVSVKELQTALSLLDLPDIGEDGADALMRVVREKFPSFCLAWSLDDRDEMHYFLSMIDQQQDTATETDFQKWTQWKSSSWADAQKFLGLEQRPPKLIAVAKYC